MAIWMEFSRARTKEQMKYRKMDIITACENLWEQEGFDGVNLKGISESTSISRSTIYNYYKTKEEIFLDILKEEIELWKEQLIKFKEEKKQMDIEQFSLKITETLLERDKLLKLYSILFTCIEPNCSLEKIVEFKLVAGDIESTLVEVMLKFFPQLSAMKAQIISGEIFCYVLGLYPMSHLNEKQKKAIAISKTSYIEPDFKMMCELGIKSFLHSSL